MKNLSTLLSLTIATLLVAGCSDEEDFSRYPSVWVPEYEKVDYIRDLSMPNSELVYNATCNLGRRAGQFSKTLCADDADSDSPEYKSAAEVYRRICRQLESKEPYTVAATLRFLQYFAKEYEPKKELIETVSRVESDHPQVQFEQVTLLMNYATKDTRLPDPLLRQLMDSPSWIVSRTTYGLIGRLHEEPLRQELVQRYKNTDEERERLILIVALGHQLTPEEARLFEKEMLATDSPKIRHAIGGGLIQNEDCPGVRTWMGDHYQEFSEAERARIFKETGDFDLTMRFLSMGFIPDDDELEDAAEGLLHIEQMKEEDPQQFEQLEEEESKMFDQLIHFDQALETAPQLNGRWKAIKDEAKQKHLRKNALREELAPISQEFIETMKALLTKYEMPASEQEKAMEKIGKALTAITGE